MTDPIPINLAAEDELSVTVLRVILKNSGKLFAIGFCRRKGGYGYLKRIAPGLNRAARSTPYLLLTDLDRGECPPILMRDWLPAPKHPNFIFRVAVHEVESWLLGHRQSFAKFTAVSAKKIPTEVDQIENPKEFLVSLARKSKKREIREGIVPMKGSTAKIGPRYNKLLCQYVRNTWNMNEAARHSGSLNRALTAIRNFTPRWIKN